MKQFLFSLTAFFFMMRIVSGQTNVYHSFPDSGVWRVDYYHYQDLVVHCHSKYYFQYYSSADTLINSFVHKKIYRSFVYQDDVWCEPNYNPPAAPPSGYAGALRDDSSANKAFFVFPNTSTDSVLFDYNLTVGDTMKGYISAYLGFSNVVVLSTDSVLINGQYRKRWNFANDNHNEPTFFIQGIGSSSGLIEPVNTYNVDFNNRYLVCVKDSSTSLYILNSPDYTSTIGCSLIIEGTTEINSANTFSIFPNPFSEQTTLQTDKLLQNASLTVYNSFGQIVKRMDKLSGQTIILQRDNLPSGLYFFRITQDNKIISANKLMITDK